MSWKTILQARAVSATRSVFAGAVSHSIALRYNPFHSHPDSDALFLPLVYPLSERESRYSSAILL
jgi:hypothetical protein